MGWGQSAVNAEEVRGETSNIGGGHGSSGESFGTPIIPSGSDVQACGEDIDGGTIIGKHSPAIGESRSGDSDRLPHAGRRGVAAVPVFTASGYDDGNTAVEKLKMESPVNGVAVTFHLFGTYRPNGRVDTAGSTATYAHRSDRGFA